MNRGARGKHGDEQRNACCCPSQRLTHGSALISNSMRIQVGTSAHLCLHCGLLLFSSLVSGITRGARRQWSRKVRGGGSRGAAERIHRGSNQMRVVGTGRVGFGTSVRGQLESKQGCNNKAAQNAGKPDAGWLRAPAGPPQLPGGSWRSVPALGRRAKEMQSGLKPEPVSAQATRRHNNSSTQTPPDAPHTPRRSDRLKSTCLYFVE